jgi:hypothetical protein
MMRCRDSFGSGDLNVFWSQVHDKLTYLHGSPSLTNDPRRSRVDDALAFLVSCSDEHFLDFVEILFRVDVFFHARAQDTVVEDFNDFLRMDDLPYAITDFVWTKGTVREFGREYEATTLTAHPQVIIKDSEVLHEMAVAPALHLLADTRFGTANAEFLEALKDFRRNAFGDCVTKCGSSFESVLKVIMPRPWLAVQE